MFENEKKRENMEIKKFFLHIYPYKISFGHRIRNFLRITDARGSADIIYHDATL